MITWDATGEHYYETGVDHGVLYPQASSGSYENGVAWNGLTSVSQNPDGAEANPLYADNIKYLNLISTEDFGCTIEAYTYPDEFEACDGSAELVSGVKIGQQNRKGFGFSYRTLMGNDVDGNEYGYKLHVVYGAKAAPSERSYETVNDSPDAITFSWEVDTTPIPVNGYKPTAHLEIDSTKFKTPEKAPLLKKLEGILYGAPTFSATATYAVGDLVEYTDSGAATPVAKLYICTTAVSEAGAWDASDWSEVGTAGPRLPLPDEIKTVLTPAS